MRQTGRIRERRHFNQVEIQISSDLKCLGKSFDSELSSVGIHEANLTNADLVVHPRLGSAGGCGASGITPCLGLRTSRSQYESGAEPPLGHRRPTVGIRIRLTRRTARLRRWPGGSHRLRDSASLSVSVRRLPAMSGTLDTRRRDAPRAADRSDGTGSARCRPRRGRGTARRPRRPLAPAETVAGPAGGGACGGPAPAAAPCRRDVIANHAYGLFELAAAAPLATAPPSSSRPDLAIDAMAARARGPRQAGSAKPSRPAPRRPGRRLAWPTCASRARNGLRATAAGRLPPPGESRRHRPRLRRAIGAEGLRLGRDALELAASLSRVGEPRAPAAGDYSLLAAGSASTVARRLQRPKRPA